MMSLHAIQQISHDAAVRACRENRIPFTVEEQDKEHWKAQFKAGTLKFPFPFLGEYVPQAWKRTDRDPLFVDSSGYGREGEPALTVMATIDALTVGKAYAIIENGQFQLHLAEYERDGAALGNDDHFVGLTSDEEQEFDEVVQEESQFDPAKMADTVEKLQREGRMPSMSEFLRAIDAEREQLQKKEVDFRVRFENDLAYFTAVSRKAVDFISNHFVGPIFDESGALVLHRVMGEAVVCSMRREGLRVA